MMKFGVFSQISMSTKFSLNLLTDHHGALHIYFLGKRKNKWNNFFVILTQYQLSSVSHSVQFSRSVVSDSLRPHELQHTRPPCPSPTLGVHPDSHPSSQWCHPAISSSVVPFSSCPQSLPTSESFPMIQHFAWGGQSTGVSSSASVLPMNIQDWFPLE